MAASTTLTKAQLTLRAKVAANTRWSRPGEPGRHADARLQHFADEIDPEHKLPEPERTERAKQRRRAHMQRLALASSKARAARKAVADAT